ncbi:MAG: EAL domain-containing protein [Cyanobacteria bacterium P01_E01_bin.34]
MTTPAIICVDDDSGILSSLEEQLSRHFGNECDIELACDAAEALDLCAELLAERIRVPIVISDQQMPGIQGDELLVRIHKLTPNTLTILLTGQSSVEAIRNAVNAANLYRFIAKPWNEADLILTVKEALRRFEQDNQLATQKRALQAANVKLEQSISLLQATLDSTADGILVVDRMGTITHFNRKLLDIWEIEPNSDPAHILYHMAHQLVHSQQLDIEQWEAEQWCQPETSEVLQLNDNRILECLSQPQYLNQHVVGRVWSFRDVTKRQKAEETIRYQANHDVLTGLANRRQFKRRLAQLLSSGRAQYNHLAVLFIDLDRFKNVNDSLGHAVGDRLLREVSERLRQCCREEDILSRWGGDEFTMAVPNLPSPKAATAIADRLLEVLLPSFNLLGHPLCVTSSIGIATYPEDGETADMLLKNADTALYQAKEDGRNCYRHFTRSLNKQGLETLALEYALNQALEQSEFSLYYQPQLNSTTGEISHMEALIRWHHPQLGTIPPTQFIPLAELNGSIVALGRWVLQTACTQAKQWHAAGIPVAVAVNLSPRQLTDRSLLQTIQEVLDRTRLENKFLELEITESGTFHNVKQAKQVLSQLSSMGIGIALDDFGTGYSSLSHLKQFPLDTIKIDRSFVRDLQHQIDDVAIAKAILELGRGLGLRVVAEGVETQELKALLESLGCQHMQGYLFSRPLTAEGATQFLLQHLNSTTRVPS